MARSQRSRRPRPKRPPTDTLHFETPPDAKRPAHAGSPGRTSRPGHTRVSHEAVASGTGRFDRFLADLVQERGYAGQAVHVRSLPAREAAYAEPQEPLPGPLAEGLAAAGISRLYVHQARALDLSREGRNVVVVTTTASGCNVRTKERLSTCITYIIPITITCRFRCSAITYRNSNNFFCYYSDLLRYYNSSTTTTTSLWITF